MKKLIILIAIALTLLLPVLSEETNWNTKGLELYKKGQYKEAVECFNRVLNDDPKAFKVWNNKGNALYKLGNYEKALLCYDKALEVSQDYSNAWYGKGCTLLQVKKYEEALACFNRVLALNPDDGDAKKKKENIISLMEIRDTKTIEEWFNRGNYLYIQEKYEEAIEYYDKITEADKNHIDAWYNRGCALKFLNRYDEALTCFDRVTELNPDYNNVKNKKAEALKFLEKEGYIVPEMVLLPAGTVELNIDTDSQNDNKSVSVGSFYICKYEVTNKEFCKYNQDRENPDDNLPAVNLTWPEAADYCNWLSQKEGLTICYDKKNPAGDYTLINIKNNGYRLPTEAEWEYACRAGTDTDYYWGNSMDDSYCWYYDNSHLMPHTVGEKKPNRSELYDMSGNVWEWCTCCFPSEATCIIKGGGFLENAGKCRSGYRGNLPVSKSIDIGFRMVRSK
ncbi:MAG: tetratricopeptide repeat protein [Candidatus Eremiobacterota bacterium]